MFLIYVDLYSQNITKTPPMLGYNTFMTQERKNERPFGII